MREQKWEIYKYVIVILTHKTTMLMRSSAGVKIIASEAGVNFRDNKCLFSFFLIQFKSAS